ncbi:MAG: hypothetical protein CV090_10110 [Nitrospira sp. WS238]|nr:hypothetical protein [Nitrospira sp. WS238]
MAVCSETGEIAQCTLRVGLTERTKRLEFGVTSVAVIMHIPPCPRGRGFLDRFCPISRVEEGKGSQEGKACVEPLRGG